MITSGASKKETVHLITSEEVAACPLIIDTFNPIESLFAFVNKKFGR